MKTKGFTLMELIIVIIIIGVIAAIGFSTYSTTRERTLDKEAFANLKLIQAAQHVYNYESAIYYPRNGSSDNNIATINQNLKLSLPNPPTNQKWSYTVIGGNGAGAGCAQATRTGDNNRVLRLRIGDTGDPTLGANCP